MVESCHHLFFGCDISREFWNNISNIASIRGEVNVFAISDGWTRGRNFAANNIINAAGLWAIWNIRNDLIFNRKMWSGMQVFWRRTAYFVALWEKLSSDHVRERLEAMVQKLEHLTSAPPPLMWPDPG